MGMTISRPVLHQADGDAAVAAQQLIEALQQGFDTGDADIYDAMFASDVLWGTPKGLVLAGYNVLNAIHHQMMGGNPVDPRSRFELAQLIQPNPGIVVAQIRRTALNGGFSEMAMYVLVKHNQRWWLAAGQNTPVVDTLPSVSPE
jgi:uncharacterized protein (TIGR02246 family)